MTEDRPDDTSVCTTAMTGLLRHNTWANLKLLDFCAGLNDDQLEATAVGTYGTVRMTLVHFLGAEVDYVHRITGKWPGLEWPDGFPGWEVLKEAASWSGGKFSEVALTSRADAIVRETFPLEKLVDEYPLSTLLVQVINHSTEHRTQISAIITQLGIEPPDMTGWAYMEAMGEFREYHQE